MTEGKRCVGINFPEDMLDTVDAQRGHFSRSSYVVTLLEERLKEPKKHD
ncbi:MAG: hypothetical protein WB643_06115 [Candidatus Bathyarchaeia archaeon]